MGVFNFFDFLLNNSVGKIVEINPTIGLISVVFVISIIITITYKLMTNQSLMKDLKEEINRLQKEVKKLSKNPEKALKVQNEMMEINMKYMMHSMRSTFVTFIPIIVIFGWLSSHIAYLPIESGDEFDVSIFLKNNEIDNVKLIVPNNLEIIDSENTKDIVKKKASWTLKGSKEGLYQIIFELNDEKISKKILISTTDYIKPTMKVKGFTEFLYESTDEYIPSESSAKLIEVKNQPFKANLLGFKIGCLGTYILFSIIFSMGLRKIMKIY